MWKVQVWKEPVRRPIERSGEHEVGMRMSPRVFEEQFKGISNSEVGMSEVNGKLETTASVGERENGS